MAGPGASLKRGHEPRRDDEWCQINPSPPGTRADVNFHHDCPTTPASGPGRSGGWLIPETAAVCATTCPRYCPRPSPGCWPATGAQQRYGSTPQTRPVPTCALWGWGESAPSILSPRSGGCSKIPPLQTLSSPGFCGGWFIWCRWLPVVIVRGGGCRVSRRLRARQGFASRWRSVAGWCSYQWTYSAVASTGGVDVLPRALVTDRLGLVQGA